MKPNYANLHGDYVTEAPYFAHGATFYNFLFEGNSNHLQMLCDQWFNEPSKGQVYMQPMLSDIIITFADYDGVRSQATPYINWGYAPYKELIFSFFVMHLDKKRGIWIAERIYAFVPYIFVDSVFAMQIGKEVLGMPKTLASFKLPTQPSQADFFSADAYMLKKFSRETPAGFHQLIELKKTKNSTATANPETFPDSKTAFKRLRETIFRNAEIPMPSPGLLKELADMLLYQKFPFVSLKQFRDLEDSTKACYQSIGDFYCDMKRFHSGGFLSGDYELKLFESDLFPIAQDLGLLPKGQKAKLGFWIKWDFEFKTGKEIWNSTQLFKSQEKSRVSA